MGRVVWVSAPRAAQILGVSRVQVVRLIQRGELTAQREGRTWKLDERYVRAAAANRDAWVSLRMAAELANCSTTRVNRAVKAGQIATRLRSGPAPTLRRADVVKLAAVTERERVADQQQRDRRRALRAEVDARRRARTTPPDSQREWLTTAQAAEVLDLGPTWTRQLAAQGRLAHVRKDGVLWFPRDALIVLTVEETKDTSART